MRITVADYERLKCEGHVFSHLARGGIARGGAHGPNPSYYFTDVEDLRTWKLTGLTVLPGGKFVCCSYDIALDEAESLRGWASYEDFESAFWEMKDRGDMGPDEHSMKRPATPEWPDTPSGPPPDFPDLNDEPQEEGYADDEGGP